MRAVRYVRQYASVYVKIHTDKAVSQTALFRNFAFANPYPYDIWKIYQKACELPSLFIGKKAFFFVPTLKFTVPSWTADGVPGREFWSSIFELQLLSTDYLPATTFCAPASSTAGTFVLLTRSGI